MRSPFFFQKYKTEIKDLEHQGELGNGTCGHVVKMLHKPSQTIIAVKVSNGLPVNTKCSLLCNLYFNYTWSPKNIDFVLYDFLS
jgi:hypothetical protein